MSFIPKLCTNAVISEFLQDFTADLRDEMQPMWERVNSVVTPLEWPFVDRKSRRVGKECRSRWSPYH